MKTIEFNFNEQTVKEVLINNEINTRLLTQLVMAQENPIATALTLVGFKVGEKEMFLEQFRDVVFYHECAKAKVIDMNTFNDKVIMVQFDTIKSRYYRTEEDANNKVDDFKTWDTSSYPVMRKVIDEDIQVVYSDLSEFKRLLERQTRNEKEYREQLKLIE